MPRKLTASLNRRSFAIRKRYRRMMAAGAMYEALKRVQADDHTTYLDTDETRYYVAYALRKAEGRDD